MWVEDTPDKHRTFALPGPQPVLRGSGIRGDRSGSRTVDLAVMLTFDGETAVVAIGLRPPRTVRCWWRPAREATRGERDDVDAYVLVQTEVGAAAPVTSEAAAIDGVVTAEAITGPYDVIMRVRADGIDALGKLVVSRLQRIEGITRTLTCPIVHI